MPPPDLLLRSGAGRGKGFLVIWWDGLIFYDVVIGGYSEYNVSDRQVEIIGSRILFTGPGINSGV